MKQIEFFEINNPCVGVCQNGPRGFCQGCFRSREERQHWNVLEQDVKRQIIKACGQRELRARLAKREKPAAPNDASQSDLL
ncbi:MAG: DUF1289 domain-containing protein [Pseudomonadales bacterium]|nr:DUF1289 domain-containing protein [Pseudomonadales bacterium]